MSLKRIKTKPQKIFFDGKMHIIWQDDYHSAYDYWELRTSCPCAECVDELTGEKILDDSKVDKNIHPVKSQYIGNYALRIYWSDQHSVGMFSLKDLRERFPHEEISSEK
ncbi:MAG: DUF971 domain-containing protein [Deltaproteobacteria bacterium]|nr:DUF971 domain-containing protein [Deltaproteobacteria bacterium]